MRHEGRTGESYGSAEREARQRFRERNAAVQCEEAEFADEPRDYHGRGGHDVHGHTGGAYPSLPDCDRKRNRYARWQDIAGGYIAGSE